jgi:hypothetical protein
MAEKEYEYIYVTRDTCGDPWVEMWAPGAPPAVRYGAYARWGGRLRAVCLGEFRRIFGWAPEPGECYRMWLYFDAEEV